MHVCACRAGGALVGNDRQLRRAGAGRQPGQGRALGRRLLQHPHPHPGHTVHDAGAPPPQQAPGRPCVWGLRARPARLCSPGDTPACSSMCFVSPGSVHCLCMGPTNAPEGRRVQAVYFGSAEHPTPQYVHYGLAAPLYTHFTSPIRRPAAVCQCPCAVHSPLGEAGLHAVYCTCACNPALA